MEVRRAATCWILDAKSPNLEERVAASITGTSEAGAATSEGRTGAETGAETGAAATSTAGAAALVFLTFFSPERVGAVSTTTVTEGAGAETGVAEAEAAVDLD